VHFPGPTNKAEQHFSFYLAYVLLSAQSLARACPEIVSSCTTKLAESENTGHHLKLSMPMDYKISTIPVFNFTKNRPIHQKNKMKPVWCDTHVFFDKPIVS
jgi:hypothetical protein